MYNKIRNKNTGVHLICTYIALYDDLSVLKSLQECMGYGEVMTNFTSQILQRYFDTMNSHKFSLTMNINKFISWSIDFQTGSYSNCKPKQMT